MDNYLLFLFELYNCTRRYLLLCSLSLIWGMEMSPQAAAALYREERDRRSAYSDANLLPSRSSFGKIEKERRKKNRRSYPEASIDIWDKGTAVSLSRIIARPCGDGIRSLSATCHGTLVPSIRPGVFRIEPAPVFDCSDEGEASIPLFP